MPEYLEDVPEERGATFNIELDEDALNDFKDMLIDAGGNPKGVDFAKYAKDLWRWIGDKIDA